MVKYLIIGIIWGDPYSAKFKVSQLMVLDKGGYYPLTFQCSLCTV